MLCSAYSPKHKTLFQELRELKIPRTTQAILTNPAAFEPLATYISTTGRFVRTKLYHPPTSNPSTIPLSPHPPPPATPLSLPPPPTLPLSISQWAPYQYT